MTQRRIYPAEGNPFTVEPDETVLEAALRQGASLPFSCRGGTCHTCLRRCTEGSVPETSQRGLGEPLRQLGYFLPCICRPETDMVITAPRASDFPVDARLEEVEPVPPAWLLRMEPLGLLAWRRHLQVVIEDSAGHRRSGRVLGLPQDDFLATIELAEKPPPSWTGNALLTVTACDEPPGQLPGPAGVGGTKRPPPDPELWHSLDEGRQVRRILDDFYSQVFADPVLAPYFHGVTQDHVAGKQYAFLRKSMTGEAVYFGDNPRDAHHWMVISNAVFERRQALMAAAQRRAGLTPDQMRRWAAYELPYRDDIVKDHPFALSRFGSERPLEGYERLALAVGTVCDGCGGEVAPGASVLSHRRLGTVYCARCSDRNAADASTPMAEGLSGP